MYHFSPIRRNLLEWYNFSENGTLLEIGAGCGAITGLFSEKLSQVTALELSMRRAEILANRHKKRENIDIVVGDLFDVEMEQKFDYVTLIGVLEYAGLSGMENPFEKFLNKVKTFLKEDGVLLIAIENKFGLKYWSGAAEDHSGIYFDSIENYHSTNHSVRTFSKKELKELLGQCGFKQLDFYYPVPDYKMPDEVFSDEFLPKAGEYNSVTPNYDRKRISLFNEKLAMDSIVDNDMFDFFQTHF